MTFVRVDMSISKNLAGMNFIYFNFRITCDASLNSPFKIWLNGKCLSRDDYPRTCFHQHMLYMHGGG